MSVEASRADPAGPPVGTVAEEAALLAEALRARGGVAHTPAADGTCTGCPLCRAQAALERSGPELTMALTEAVGAVRGVWRVVRTAYADTARDGGASRTSEPTGATSDEGRG